MLGRLSCWDDLTPADILPLGHGAGPHDLTRPFPALNFCGYAGIVQPPPHDLRRDSQLLVTSAGSMSSIEIQQTEACVTAWQSAGHLKVLSMC